jgi:hypothetical protein
LALLPAAQVAARAAFEASARAAWLVDAADPFEREKRWLAHLEGEEDYLRRKIRELEAFDMDSSSSRKWLDSLEQFRRSVTSLLMARGYTTDAAVPNFRDCLRSLGEERTYGLYMKLSQMTHATHSSTWLYRSGGVGTAKVEGEFVSAEEWDLSLAICRFAFKTPARIVLCRLGADATGLIQLVR